MRPIDKTIVKGALDEWDCNDLTVNPGGIFADVRLLLSTDVYLGRVKATPLVDAADGSARVLCRVEAVNTTGRFLTVSLGAALEPANFAGTAARPSWTSGSTWPSRGCGGRGTWAGSPSTP